MSTEPLSAPLLLSDPEGYLKVQWVSQYQRMTASWLVQTACLRSLLITIFFNLKQLDWFGDECNKRLHQTSKMIMWFVSSLMDVRMMVMIVVSLQVSCYLLIIFGWTASKNKSVQLIKSPEACFDKQACWRIQIFSLCFIYYWYMMSTYWCIEMTSRIWSLKFERVIYQMCLIFLTH